MDSIPSRRTFEPSSLHDLEQRMQIVLKRERLIQKRFAITLALIGILLAGAIMVLVSQAAR